MNNYYCFFIASITMLQIFSESMVGIKIDGAVTLINEDMIVEAVSEKSKVDAYGQNDISLLAIDHSYLEAIIDKTLSENLPFLDYDVYYYFYDSVTLNSCPIGTYECNSVQMKMDFKYHNKTYERIVRYEPVACSS